MEQYSLRTFLLTEASEHGRDAFAEFFGGVDVGGGLGGVGEVGKAVGGQGGEGLGAGAVEGAVVLHLECAEDVAEQGAEGKSAGGAVVAGVGEDGEDGFAPALGVG